jgi:autotransporter-associated beta strand protein
MSVSPSSPPLNRTLWLALIAFALLLPSGSRAALVAYWNFDEASGTSVFDTAGNTSRTNNGVFGGTGSTAPNRIPGRLGGALSFAWTANPTTGGQLVTVPNHTNLTLNGPFTVSFWYRPDAVVPILGTHFPGIVRIGSQGNAAPYGWGFFRQNNMVFKRGNIQPGTFPALNFGQWNHLAVRYDGVPASSNTLYFLNGVQLAPFVATNGWTNVASTAVFEMGRMDHWDTASLDDLALWGNEAVSPAKIRSLYTVPTSLFLSYDLADMRSLWATFDAGAGTTNSIKGLNWSYTSTLPGSTNLGDAYLIGSTFYVVLSNGVGVSAPLTFIGGPFSPGGVGAISTLTLSDSLSISNARLVWDINTATNDLINVTGDLNIGNSLISFDPFTTLTPGNYRLFNYTGIKNGSLTVSNTTRYTLTLDESTPGRIDLVVSGDPGSVIWNSLSSGAWDLSSLNWSNLIGGTNDRFFQGDAVRFDDSGAFQTNITVTTPVFPNSITVDSSTRPYIFTGAEQIGGLGNGLTKNGTGALVISTPNTFVGNVNVNAGTLRIGNAGALGTTNGETIIAAGATLDLAGINPGTESVTVQGSGVGGAGAVVNTVANIVNNGLRGRVTLAGDTTFGAPFRWDILNTVVQGNGFNVTKIGGQEMFLSGNGNMGFSNVTVQAGTLTWGGNSTPGDPSATYTVNSGATLNFFSHTVPFNKVLVLQGGANVQNGSGTPNLAGPVTLNGTVNFNLGNPLLVSNAISGAGSISKIGANALTLFGTNTYTGFTTISAGRINLLPDASIAASSRINVLSGAVFDVSRVAGPYALGSTQTLAGVGTIAGSLAVPTGSLLLPGAENVAGTLTVTNALALAGGTVAFEIAAATTEGGGVNDLINVGGSLDLSGVTSISVNPLGILTIGNSYTLINYTGTLIGSVANLAITNNSRYTFSLNTDTPGKLILKVEGGAAKELYWFGGAPGMDNLWDIQVSPNWSDTEGGTELFYGGDVVHFLDFTLTNIIDLVGTLTPAAVYIENGEPDFDYVFQGSGKLSGNSTLTKIGVSKATIANTGVNDYVGPTDVQANAKLQFGTGGTFGNIGVGPITNNGTLIFNRSDNLTLANRLEGSSSGNLIKSNANVLILPTNNSNYNGTITAAAGIIRPTITNGLGSGAGPTVIAAGATLDINAINLSEEPVVVEGAGVGGNGAIISAAGAQNNALRFVTLSGNTTVGGANRWDIRAAPTASLSANSNGYSLTKVGAGQFSLVDVVVDSTLGDINVNAGTFSAELQSGAGDPLRTITMANGATFQLWGRTAPWNKVSVFNGGRVLNGNGTATMNGLMTLNGPVTFEGVASTITTVADPINGPGSLTKVHTGAAGTTSTLILGSDNTYAGNTTLSGSGGILQLGTGGNSGWVTGTIAVGGNTLAIYRSDTVYMTNTVTGTFNFNVRTPAGLVFTNPFAFTGTVNVGPASPGRLVLEPGFTANLAGLSVGDSPGGFYGEVYHNAGNLNISGLCRVGHWPNASSTYIMGGGNLNLTGNPGANVVNGSTEQNGILYLGVDGNGLFIQTGGVARAHGIVMDTRGVSPGVDVFSLEGGQFIVGPSGIKAGGLDTNTPSTYSIRLGGGTLSSSANWTSTLGMTLTGTNGDVRLDTAAFTNTLTGTLVGPGGLIKQGPGTLQFNGVYNATGIVAVTQGTLAGNGIINGPVAVQSGGTLSPGTSIGTLQVNNALSLSGNTVIEVNKTGAVLTGDRVQGITTLTYGGTLTVVATGNALTNGDTFVVFGAANYAGGFTATNLPALAPGLIWDLSGLAVNGSIKVVAPRARFVSPVRNGNTLTLAGSGGIPGGAFRVLRSADVTLPLASWTEATTGNYDGSGNFSVDITIVPTEPQLFYVIVTL